MFVLLVSVFLNYFDNPGGMIPTWLINWAAKVISQFISQHALLEKKPVHCVRADGARATSRAGIKMFYCQLAAALLEGIWLVQSERPGCRWSFQKQLLSDWTRQMPSQRSDT